MKAERNFIIVLKLDTTACKKKISADKLRMTFKAQPCFEAKNAEKFFSFLMFLTVKVMLNKGRFCHQAGTAKSILTFLCEA